MAVCVRRRRDDVAALRGKAFLLIHPGFGISTAWAYQQLAKFPEALNGAAPSKNGPRGAHLAQRFGQGANAVALRHILVAYEGGQVPRQHWT